MIDDHVRSKTVQGETAERFRETGDRMAEAQRVARIGSWSFDVASGIRVWSDELYRLFGHEPGDIGRLLRPSHCVSDRQ